LVWKPDVDLIGSQTEQLAREQAVSLRRNEEEALRVAENFNLAVIAYISDALNVLRNDRLEDIPSHHKQYLAWLHLQEERFQNGKILHQKPEWESIINDPEQKNQLFRRVIDSGPEGALTSRIGSNLIGILRQEIDLIQLMFGDELMESYYRELHGTESIHHLLRSYLDVYSHKYSELKILEIGAGTGGTTLPILEALYPNGQPSRVATYTYTDISPGFFEKAKDKFKSWRNVLDFKRLDIEKDPFSQGFERNQYDIVIAANVLHATADLNKTLSNVLSLLRPNGKLVLQEGAATGHLSGQLVFGTLPGWWLSIEPSRKWSPLLTEPEWNDMLLKNGFSGADLVLKDYLNENIHGQSLIISTAPSLTPIHHDDHKAIIVFSSLEALGPFLVTIRASMQKIGIPEASVVHYKDLEGRDLKQTVCIALLELESSVFVDGEANFTIIRRMLTTAAGVLWVTGDTISNPQLSLSTGVIRTARWERDLDDSNLVILGIEFKTQDPITSAAQISEIYRYQFMQQNKQRNAEYCSLGGLIHTNRLTTADYLDEFLFSRVSKPKAQLLPFRKDQNRALKLSTDTPGLLNKLQFIDCPTFETELGLDDVEVEIKATGLNFRDIMSAMGEVRGDILGAEGAGIVTRTGANVKSVKVDDRVVLLASLTGCFQTFARTKELCVVKIPDDVTFEKAAGIPVIYCTAIYCLVDIAKLQKGESVLIHAAAGGVGQAAIMLAQNIGAEIFATVSSEEKKKILVDTYNIKEDHILSSRDLSFAKGVMRLTNGRGVDVILNSLAGEALRVSWECIAPFGRFVEIGKRDIYGNGRLEMFTFSKNVIFASCDLETVMRLDPTTTSKLLHRTMSLWEEGKIKEPTPLNVFNFSQIEASFRLVQSGKHIGKVVLTAGKDDLVPVSPPLCEPLSSQDQMIIRLYQNPKLHTSSRGMEHTSWQEGLEDLAEAWPVGWSRVGRVT
jgi:NADPH:quinone reductase-like Zn-dependent oxidoreductase/SAM-dependent methyltransferase